MTISASTVLSRVNEICKRSETDIDNEIKEAVIEISVRSMILKSSSSGTLSSGSYTITEPTDLVEIDSFYLDEIPLDKLSFKEYLNGKLKGYARRNGTIYIAPTPNSDLSYTLYYSKRHASSTTIEYDDEWQMAVIYLVCSKIFENYGMLDKKEYYNLQFERELEKFNTPEEPSICEARGTGDVRI